MVHRPITQTTSLVGKHDTKSTNTTHKDKITHMSKIRHRGPPKPRAYSRLFLAIYKHLTLSFFFSFENCSWWRRFGASNPYTFNEYNEKIVLIYNGQKK